MTSVSPFRVPSVVLALLALGGCGNRGDLYLAPDAGLAEDVERLVDTLPGDTGVPSTVRPADGAALDPPVPPLPDADAGTGADTDVDEGSDGAERRRGRLR